MDTHKKKGLSSLPESKDAAKIRPGPLSPAQRPHLHPPPPPVNGEGRVCRMLSVWAMQTQLFQTSIKEVVSVESVQLGLCDRASLSELPVIVGELTIHFGVSHEVLRAFGALLSKAWTRWHFSTPPPSIRGCTVVFLCLLKQRVVL